MHAHVMGEASRGPATLQQLTCSSSDGFLSFTRWFTSCGAAASHRQAQAIVDAVAVVLTKSEVMDVAHAVCVHACLRVCTRSCVCVCRRSGRRSGYRNGQRVRNAPATVSA
jgi:hypothetical protein